MIFHDNIYDLAIENNERKKMIAQGPHSELWLISLSSGDETDVKKLADRDKTYVVVEGEGTVIINGKASFIPLDHLVFIPAGTTYQIKNTGTGDLKMFAICSFEKK